MNQADPENIPRHVAVIMDGNGRWAKERGQERVYGHVNGVESMRKVIRAAMKWGVKYLTAYAFSTENWGRPREEVDALMELLCRTIADETDELDANGVRIRFIGQTDVLSDVVRESISRSERSTKHNDKLHLIIALNYSSRWEIVRMAQRVARRRLAGLRHRCRGRFAQSRDGRYSRSRSADPNERRIATEQFPAVAAFV